MMTPETETQIVAQAARAHSIAESALRHRLRLHLPRLGSHVDSRNVRREADRLAVQLHSVQQPYSAWTHEPRGGIRLGDTTFAPVDERDARILLERFHYLQAFRNASEHYALLCGDGDRIVAMASVSGFDLNHMTKRLPLDVCEDQVRVVSRVFAFDWAPRNSISFLLSRVSRVLAAPPSGIRMLVTYLNPNLGFSGASYRASNWRRFGIEVGTTLCYLDGDYVTQRQLATTFGPASPDELADRLAPRLTVVRERLLPLDIYAYSPDPEIRRSLESSAPEVFDVEHWKPRPDPR